MTLFRPPKDIPAERGERNRWALAVGRVIVAFGEIEQATDYTLRRLVRPPSAFEAVSRLPFRVRASLLAGILGERVYDGGPQEVALLKGLRAALPLSEVRNVLAHIPHGVAIHVDDDGWPHIIAEGVSYVRRRRPRTLSYAEVARKAEATEALERQIWDATIALQEHDERKETDE